MPDFWKFELETRKKYVPKDIKTGKRQTFDLGYFFDRFNSKDDEKKSTDYAIYLGSETTPPCKDFVFYIVNFLPLNIPNCQFKIFRENSLLTHRDRETHARLLRENTKSGPPEIRRVLKADVVPKPPAPPVPAPPVKPKIINGVEVTYVGQKTEPPAEPNHVPNCELKRDMN